MESADDEYGPRDLEQLMWGLNLFMTPMSAASSTYEMTARGSTVRVSRRMKQVLDVFRIEFPEPKNSKWSPTICRVPEELKKGDDNGCYNPVAVRIGLCGLLPLPPQLKLKVAKQIEETATKTELRARKTEELWKKLPKEHRDLERYKSSCVVQLIMRRPRPDNNTNPAEIMRHLFERMKYRVTDIYQCHSDPYVGVSILEDLRTMPIDGCFILHRLLKYAHLADRVAAAKQPQGGSSENNGNCWIQTAGGRCFALVWQLLTRQTPPPVQQQGDQQGSSSEEVDDDDDYGDDDWSTSREINEPAAAAVTSEVDDDDYGDDDWSQTRGRCFVWQLVTRDLLLLENQIPFFVLLDLFEELKKDGESPETLVKGSLMLFRALCPQMLPDSVPVSVSSIANSNPCGVHHLLHLFYLLVGGKELKHSAGPRDNNDDPKARSSSTQEEEKEPRGLTDVLPSELPQWIPGAKELLDAGIRLRKKKKAASFLDVEFDIRSGVLEIPPLLLYDYSEPVFRNMIALEQTYPRTQFHVSTYAVFMNCLVSSAEDARILHLRGILVNMMNGGDQDGGRHFFDRICSHVHFPSNNYLVHTMAGVNKYIQYRRHRWRAALVRDYFSNPWVAISLVAAAFLLCLTVLQTVFTVYPYFKPPK